MANTLGRNIEFPIYQEDGVTPFHDLVLKKSSYESTVMSLDDKISGDVYYKDNALSVTMQERIYYNGVPFVLVNPPTIVREGIVTDNSSLKGLTKYSFVFYHPMYQLNNMPFADVAVSNDEKRFLSESKNFGWAGYPNDFINKLNKNLQNTEWIVVKSSRFPNAKDEEISDVLSFDKNTIADALKKWYETWKVPFVIDIIDEDDALYAQGKRYKIVMGLASNEIYASEEDKQNNNPFVFQMGQGVGLKNNSRTPKNNKIVTRISGYGSEDNIPYGYPQIIWYGDQRWDFTEYEGDVINFDDKGKVTNTPKVGAYPLYMGIVGGQYVKLIKHPFVRKHLMPTIYSTTLFNKTSKYAEHPTPSSDYTRTLTDEMARLDMVITRTTDREYHQALLDLKDAIMEVSTHTSTYRVNINHGSINGYVSVDDHLIMNGIITATGGMNYPINKVLNDWLAMPLNPDYNPDLELVDYYDAIDDIYPNKINPLAPSYEMQEFSTIKPELDSERTLGIISALPLNDNLTSADKWDSTIDDNGKSNQSYFQITLPQLSFDLYACAAITQSMKINMRTGACMGCTFEVQVDWDSYKQNFYDAHGNFAPNGSQRNYDKFPNSSLGSIKVVLKKDNETFGTIMPNEYQYPQSNDVFVFIGISLPLSYISNAEHRLDDAMKSYMLKNNVYYFEYPLKFDEYFLSTHTNILAQIKPNTAIRFNYAGDELELFVKQISIKYGENVLPQYNITLTDDIDVVLNQVSQVSQDVDNISSLVSILKENYDNNVILQLLSKLSKKDDDVAQGLIRFAKGILFGNGEYGIDDNGNANLLSLLTQTINNTDKITTKDLTVTGLLNVFQLVIDSIKSASGGIIITPADGFTVNMVEAPSNEYQNVEYISNPNNGYINTGVIPTENTRIKAKVRFTKPNQGGLQVLYGATSDNADEYFETSYYDGNIIYEYDPNKVQIEVIGDGTIEITSDDLSYNYLLGMVGDNVNKSHLHFGNVEDNSIDNASGTYEIEQSSTYVKIGSNSKNIDFTSIEVESLNKPLYLFANNGYNGAELFDHCDAIENFLIYDGDVVVRDFVPQKRNNVYGFYDRITETFYTSEGDAFSGGSARANGYTLYWQAGTDSKQRGNMWQVGDFALCQSFNNAISGVSRETSNKKYWAKVIDASSFNEPIEMALPNGTSAPCHYIVLSNANGEYTGILNPEVGDDIVMLGSTNVGRQSAIYMSAYDSIDNGYTDGTTTIQGINAPLFAIYEGINDFNLSKHRTTFFANGDNAIVGNVKITSSGQTVSVEKYISDTIDDKAPYIGNDGYWYVWDATTSSYKKNIKAEGENGRNGQDGVTVLNTYTKYSTNHGNVQPNKATFTLDSIGATTLGDYIWSLQTTVYSDGKTSEVYSVSRIGENGINGTNGKDGIDGKDGTNGKDAEYDKIDVSKSIAEVSYSEQSKDVLSYSIEGKILKVVGDSLLTPTPSDYQLILRPSNYANGSHDINITIGQDCTFTATNNSYMSNYSKAQSRPTAFILILKKKNNDNTYSIIDNYVINVSAPPVATMTLDSEINLQVTDLTNSLNDAGINIALGKITLDAANTEVTGNLNFYGFVRSKITHITNENKSHYGFAVGSLYFYLDFNKCGTFISWDVTDMQGGYINLPHIDEHTFYYTQEQRDNVRSLLGTTIKIYNNGEGFINLMYYMTEPDIEHSTGPHTSNAVTRDGKTEFYLNPWGILKGEFMVLRCSATTINGKETIGWEQIAIGTADNVSNE